MGPSRVPARVFAASLLILLGFLTFQHLRRVPHEARFSYETAVSQAKQEEETNTDNTDVADPSKDIPLFPGPDILVHPLPESEASSPTPNPELTEDAHKLPTADSFLPHFKAVTQIQPLRVEDAKSGCQWPAQNEVNFQFLEENYEWVKHDPSEQDVETKRQEWHDFIDNKLLPFAEHEKRFEGRGIVIVAGNQQSMKRVKVLLRALKRLESRMPIEIQYWGDELTDESRKDISSMWSEMYFSDLSAASNIIKTNHDGEFINYQLKTAAIVNSRFAEPLMLDSDNIPVVAPESLYESETYKEYGTLFWPDIARTRPNNPVWSITNTLCRTDEYEQESGQLIVDKRRYFYHLQLAAWMNNEQGKYYNKYLLGDKDTFRFAWHALRTKYGAPPKWLSSVGTVSDDGFYCGHSFAQFSPEGKVAFLHGGLIKTMTKEVMKWQKESRGGIFQVYKKSEFEEQHFVNVNVSIKFDHADYLPNRPQELEAAMCTDFHQVDARPLEELVPGFEKVFDEIGGYWMLDD